MCICNDRRWPETFRTLSLLGAEIILYVLDPSSLQEYTIEEQLNVLTKEISNYDKNIEQIRKIIVINKIDLLTNEKFDNYIDISCKDGTGIDRLLNEIDNMIKENKPTFLQRRKHFELTKPKFSSHIIKKVKGAWTINGSTIDRMCNLVGNSEEVGNEIMRRFEESGIEQELRTKGIKNGDTIILGSQEFVFND